MTGSEFYNYCLRVFKRTDKSTEVYEAITDAILEVKLRLQMDDFKTVDATSQISVSGNYTFDVPSDFGHLIGDVVMVDVSGGSRIVPVISKPAWDTLYPDVAETSPNTGVPRHVALYGGKFYVGPVPDSTSYYYQLNYTQEAVTEIVSGTTSVPFSTMYREWLRAIVLKKLYAGLGTNDEATKWSSAGEYGLAMIEARERRNANEGVFNVVFSDI